MNNPKDILDIALSRLKESELLLQFGFYDGAFYLAGYRVELALKAQICQLLNLPNLFGDGDDKHPDLKDSDIKPFKTHNLKTLLLFSGKGQTFSIDKRKNKELGRNWNIVSNEWTEKCRYLPCGTKQKSDTLTLINAINHPQNGILTWILEH